MLATTKRECVPPTMGMVGGLLSPSLPLTVDPRKTTPSRSSDP